MAYQNILVLIAGISCGLISLPRILYPLYSILPNFREIRDITKLETSHLLYIILSTPVLWTSFLICTLLAVIQFLPQHLFIFLAGLLTASFLAMPEFYWEREELQSRFMNSLRDDLLMPAEEPGSKFPTYSALQMRTACWRANDLNISPYRNLVYECAVCNRLRLLATAAVHFRGNRKRYIVECDLCSKPSIVRVTGTPFSKPRIVTEARLPFYDTSLDTEDLDLWEGNPRVEDYRNKVFLVPKSNIQR